MASVQSSVDDLGDMRKHWSGPTKPQKADRPWTYLSIIAGLTVAGLATIFSANRSFAPEMYFDPAAQDIGRALAKGQNYAAFDLNVNIREIRSGQIEQLAEAPAVALIGASHWQEAHADLSPSRGFFNAHVHRDYYEDLLAMTEVFVRNNKLPRTMVISVRDHLFEPIEARKDYLWLPAVANYRAMAARLGIEPHGTWATLPTVRWREQISVPMLFGNVTRWYNANEKPSVTDQRNFDSLDTLLPDGSIQWSDQHRNIFTPARARTLALAAAATQAPVAPSIDPRGVEAVDALFSYLTNLGVDVVIAFPPFNPVYFDAVRDTPYMRGLEKVEAIARGFADKYHLRTIGHFDPARVGCKAEMYIDSEHSNPKCLARVLEQLGPVAPPGNVWALSELERSIPANDLGRQQVLILRNARAQIDAQPDAHGDALAPVAEEPRALGGIGNSPAQTADADARSQAKASRPAASSKPVQAKVARPSRLARDEGNDDERADDPQLPAKRRKVQQRRLATVLQRSPAPREYVWPGDAVSNPIVRRDVRVQRFSQADR